MAKRFSRKIAVALVIALCFAMMPGIQQLQASSTTGSVTFTYEGMQDCTIRLYYVADYSETDGYRISSDFAETNVSRQDIEDENWYSLAMTLENLVIGFDITPAASGTTDEDGQVTLTGLKEGLYLVTIESMTVGNTIYTAQPLLIMIPEYDSDGTANYDESVTITKYETQEVTETTSISIQKVWDDDSSSNRPTSLEVYLLSSDGSIVDTQTLNDSNNWRYTWSDLDGSQVWYVMEENLDDYGVSYTSADDGTIVMTNEQGTGRTHSMQTIPPDDGGDTETIEDLQTETEETEPTETETESESTSELESTENSNYVEVTETTETTDTIESSEEPDTESSETAAESESDDGSESTGSSQSAGSSGTDGSGSGTSSQGSTSAALPQTGANWWIVIALTIVAAGCFLVGVRMDPLSKHKEEKKSNAES